MKAAAISGALIVAVLALVALVAVRRGRERERHVEPVPEMDGRREAGPSTSPSDATAATAADRGFLYGRITSVDGEVYAGRLRWGGVEEAFWSDTFDGLRDENVWAAHAPREALVTLEPIELFGIVFARREREIDLERPFMARFGDIQRIEARALDIRVRLKSGSEFSLDRFAGDDLADGVRVWDARHGVVDLDERSIRTIEFLPTPGLGAVPGRLLGTVRTRQGDFTGCIRWDWEKSVESDVLRGQTAEGEVDLPFNSIRTIERDAADSARITLDDGREQVLSGTRDVGQDNRGIGVDDRRYGRVLIAWDIFERVDFVPGYTGPAYGDFPPGRQLTGTVAIRDGGTVTGRIVFDLDESETTETLDAPLDGVDYSIPFGLIASIAPSVGDGTEPGDDTGPGDGRARDDGSAVVVLHGGEALRLERFGDLGDGNLGLLVFAEADPSAVDSRARYVPWGDVERIDFAGAEGVERVEGVGCEVDL